MLGMKILNIIFCLFLATFSLHAMQDPGGKVIVIMGPSCAGKSTIAKGLKKHLGDGWVCRVAG